MLHAPALLLCHRVPGDQAAEGRALGRLHVDQRGRVPADVAVRLGQRAAVELPVLVVLQGQRHMLGRQVGQARVGAVGHGMPVVRAEGAGDHVARAVAAARNRRLDGPALGVVAAGPVHIDEVLGRDELAVGAVDDEEEAVLGRMQDDLARLAADLDVGQHHGLGGGEVPAVARRFLVVPDVLARIGVQRHDAGQVQVVATGRAALGLRPGRAVARADVHEVELGVIGHGVPGRAAATGLPPLAGRVPGLGGAGHGLVLERLGRVAGHGEPAPLLRAGLGVIGRDIAAHAVLGAAVADQHLALDDARRARDGVRVGAVDDGVLLPDLLARGRVQRHQAAIEGAHIHLALVDRHAPVDHVAAALEAVGAVHAGVVAPQALAGAYVHRMHHAPAGGDVHDSIDHHGRGLHAARGFQVIRPDQAQPLHIGRVQLPEFGKARLAVVHAVAGPVLGAARVVADALRVDARGDGAYVLGRAFAWQAGLRQRGAGKGQHQAGGQQRGGKHVGLHVVSSPVWFVFACMAQGARAPCGRR